LIIVVCSVVIYTDSCGVRCLSGVNLSTSHQRMGS